MSRLWVCLCREEDREALRETIGQYAPEAKTVFVESAGELRSWARDVGPGVHVAVGPLDKGFSSLNVAAAVARDGKASQVVVVQQEPGEDFLRKANLLGADAVLDLLRGQGDEDIDLDEPSLASDEIPTLVMDAGHGMSGQLLHALPNIAEPAPARREEEDRPVGITEDVQERRSQWVKPPSSTSPAEPSGGAPVIVFVSGRGGVGKTSVLAAMAYVAGSWGMKVAACDLDLACGNLYSCFGVAAPSDLGALCAEKHLDSVEVQACGRAVNDQITVWGPCERPEMADVVYPHAGQLLSILRQSSDLVLVDTPATFTDAVAQAAQLCDRLVLVVDGRPGSAVAQTRMGGLAVRLGVARTRIARLANRCGRRGRGEPGINRAEVGLETARPLRVNEGGMEVVDCLGEGKVQDLFDMGSKFADTSAESLAKLLNELGCLPDVSEARRLVERRQQRSLWTFGRAREAV